MDSSNLGQYLAWFESLAREKIITETVDPGFYDDKDLKWEILRTDMIHPICSGNKFFKLKYFLVDALQKKYTTVITSGGPWSNHIVATAFAAKACGLSSIGMISGEKPAIFSQTLLDAADLGMELRFVGRANYGKPPVAEAGHYYIPAGGYGEYGAKGAGEMLHYADGLPYTHILCASGTGTMLAGLTQAAPSARVLGVAALKHSQLGIEAGELIERTELQMIHNFHFGGYAKKNQELIDFMNEFYTATGIPTDFVYTGKLMFAIRQLIQQQFFPPHSRILAIHSGGLQGNNSLKKGQLLY
jgi:1-aminocyclopropane-1-carboxylate deaminase